MMRFSTAFAALVAVLITASCGTSGKRILQGERQVGILEPGQLLVSAREALAKDGCEKAVPTFRIIASYGAGYNVAQYELGACLIELAERDDEEAFLFLDEALFWLRRAAWADNARAQGRLAILLSGAPAAKTKLTQLSPEEAMGWALVYENNSSRDLYGLSALNKGTLQHLKSGLTDDAIARAEEFSNAFTPIKMASFSPPFQSITPGPGKSITIEPRRRGRR